MIELKLNAGMSFEKKYTVENKHLADIVGSGSISVLSTPSMISMMENAAMIFIQQHLPEGYITVGTNVNISHLKAIKEGEIVKIKVIIKEIMKMHLVFEVVALIGGNKIGEGIHERHIVHQERFLENII